MPIENIPSVLKHGILSHDGCSKLPHTDVSMSEIQERRDQKKVPGGLKLHKYANLYFDARNPMMYKRKEQYENLCVLQVSVDVLKIEGTVLADMNAAADMVSFFPPDYLNRLKFDKIYTKDWTDNDRIEYLRKKAYKCAEVLIPHCIDSNYINGAYVATTNARKKLISQGFELEININPNIFFL